MVDVTRLYDVWISSLQYRGIRRGGSYVRSTRRTDYTESWRRAGRKQDLIS
jgi:hypothetical protein